MRLGVSFTTSDGKDCVCIDRPQQDLFVDDLMGDLFEMTNTEPTPIPAPAAVSGFDHAALPADVAAQARKVAKQIIESQELHLAMAIEAGQALAQSQTDSDGL